CPTTGTARSAATRSDSCRETRVIDILRLPRGGGRRLRPEPDLLHAPRGDLGRQDFVVAAAIHHVDGAELAGALPRVAELPHECAVELHLVDLAGDGPRRGVVVVRVRIRAI